MSKPTRFLAVEDLDATETLAAAEKIVHERRAVEVQEVEVALHWADLHGQLPAESEQRPRPGGPRLVQLGGVGTPKIVDLAIGEFAIARGQNVLATRLFLADVLDLRHRLPELYAAFGEGQMDLWVARKVASMTRKLDPAGAGLVDRAVTEAVDQGPGRLLSITEAKVIEADTEQARAEREAARRDRYVAITPTDEETGLRTVIAPVVPADAVWLDAQVERVADALDARRDLIPDLAEDCTRDELRSAALGWLAHPEDVVALLAGEEQPRGNGATTRNAVVYVHLHQAALEGADAVARVEGLGPLLLDELTGLLGHARVTLAPVIDLAEQSSVNGYEHPQKVRERTLLRTVGDVFPHASTISRNNDLDHPDPYTPNGPPGQTGDHNAAPLGRRHHRTKTHLGYQCRQLGPGRYLWRTPHGLYRLIDASGTHRLDPAEALALTHPEALQAVVAQMESNLRARARTDGARG
ncbi:MAG TPA: hypothetical protein PLZ93_01545 [Nocardioides sp.]|nr:hypothetical protein [Nocardioides sp.]